ncbi:MAG TPA: hypothetical protein DCQ83_07640 [Fibrobacteres bacterium]|nr:hypothetical protein [Fibrobacterota bacterium]
MLNASGLKFWHQLDLPLEEFCRISGLDTASWIRQVQDLPVPPEDSDWAKEPLYLIMDHLTAQHREFRTKHLSNILHLLEREGLPIYPDAFWLQHVHRAFLSFKKVFLAHMREEENRIFPHILRLEAFLCDPHAQSLLSEIALETFATEDLNILEDHLKKTVANIFDKIRAHHIQEPLISIANELRMELDQFEKLLSRHNSIETRYLFSRALKMEKRFAIFTRFENGRPVLAYAKK